MSSSFVFTDFSLRKVRISQDSKINLYDFMSNMLDLLFMENPLLKQAFLHESTDYVTWILNVFKQSLVCGHGYTYYPYVNDPTKPHSGLYCGIPSANGKIYHWIVNIPSYTDYYMDIKQLQDFIQMMNSFSVFITNKIQVICVLVGMCQIQPGTYGSIMGDHYNYKKIVNGIPFVNHPYPWISCELHKIQGSEFELIKNNYKFHKFNDKISMKHIEVISDLMKLENICISLNNEIDIHVETIECQSKYILGFKHGTRDLIKTHKLKCDELSHNISILNQENDELSQQNQELLDIINTHIDRTRNILIL